MGFAGMSFSRRRFLKWLAGSLLGGTALTGVGASWTLKIEPRWLVVEEVIVPLRRLPPALDGLRIAHLSDLHLGPDIRAEHLEEAAALTMSLQADLIVLTGDYVTRRAEYGPGLVKPLSRLRAPLGVYATLGNHDHWAGAQEIANHLAAAGLSVMRNASRPITRDGATLWLVGLDDVWFGSGDLREALAGVPPDACKVALVHEPDFADRSARHDIDLQLSGHTHGGQVRLPGLGPLILPKWGRKYPIGLQRAGETWVYTSRGVGLVSPPIRFNCPPEIALLTLRRDGEPRTY
jgi:predicted MPP superfamily phosphohydrolase